MSYVKRNCVCSLAENGEGKRKNTEIKMGENIVINRREKGKRKYDFHACFSNIFAILEPLEYMKKYLQLRMIKARNDFRYHLVQPPYLIEIIDNEDKVKK